MAKITLNGAVIETVGKLPEVGSQAPAFTLVAGDLSEISLSAYVGKMVVLNIFPSLDTGVCAASVRRFNESVSSAQGGVVLCVSADLPFASSRFCEAEGLKNVVPLSVFRAPEFGENYGVTVATGPLRGLLSRAVVVISGSGQVLYTEQVPEIGEEPDYEVVLSYL